MKAHYKVYNRRRYLLYFFTTTQRNLEYCLNHIENKLRDVPYYTVEINGKVVWEKKRVRYLKKVLDKKTGEVYSSAKVAAEKTNKTYGNMRWLLSQSMRRFEYIK